VLSCYDPRLEQRRIADVLGVSSHTVKKLLQRLRQSMRSRRIHAVHLRLLEALGIHGAVVELEPPDARELLRRIRPFRAPVSPAAIEDVVPLARLLGTVIKLSDGRLLAVYRVPEGLEAEVGDVLGKDPRLRRVLDWRLYSVPVRGCLEPGEAEEWFQSMHGYRFSAAKPLADMLAVGVLDVNPLARLRADDMEPGRLLEARLGVEVDGRRLYPLVRTRYRLLSLYGLAGRVYYVQPSDLLRSKSLIVAEASAAPAIYRVAVETMGAAYVAAGEELALATASADAERLHARAQAAGASVNDVVYAAVLPPPVELYDCRRRRYRLDPLPLEEVLACLEDALATAAAARRPAKLG